MNSRLPCRSITVSWITLAADEACRGHLNAVFLFWPLALCPFLASVAPRIGCSAARLARLSELIMPDPSPMFSEGVMADPDEADADHAGETGAREPFQPAACSIVAGFAEIDRRQLALRPWHLAEKDGWESGSGDRHQGLAKLTTRKATAAVKQSAFPPSIGSRPYAILRASTLRRADNTEAVAVPLARRDCRRWGLVFPR